MKNRIVDLEFMDYVRSLPCIICGIYGVEVHHVKGRGMGGARRNDRETVPLCPEHHRGKFSPHGRDVKEFYEHIPKHEMLEIAKRLSDDYEIQK